MEEAEGSVVVEAATSLPETETASDESDEDSSMNGSIIDWKGLSGTEAGSRNRADSRIPAVFRPRAVTC